MTDLLSPSPWSSRQDSLRQHPPISYAGLQEINSGLCRDFNSLLVRESKASDARDSYRTMCAELCEAANDTIERAQMWAGALPNPVDRSLDRLDEALTKARKLLEGK